MGNLIMFDLEQHIRDWRRETEATLAFSADELDELEDHLRLAFEAKCARPLPVEQAWNESITALGASSLLAPEFAKEKLMPALGRLLYSWWKPALLCALFASVFGTWSFDDSGHFSSRITLWCALGFATAGSFLFLPDRAHKNALLAGVGLAFCLIPLLHDLFYGASMEKMIGPGWKNMGASFGLLPSILGLVGLIVLGQWRRMRRPAPEESPRALFAVTESLVLLLAVIPILCEVIGDLSLRPLYSLPTPAQAHLTGNPLSEFLKFKFVAVLADAMIFLTTWVPPILIAVAVFASVPLFLSRHAVRPSAEVFPAQRDIFWIMLLATSGCFLVWGLGIDSAYRGQLANMEANYPGILSSGDGGGLISPIVLIAAFFGLSAVKWAASLRQATRIQPYYASMAVVIEAVTVMGVALNVAFANAGLFVALTGLAILLLGTVQIRLIGVKSRTGNQETSVSKVDGTDLVRQGLQFGLIIAGTGSVLFVLAIAMAYDSVVFIHALIDWGNSFKTPFPAFHPGDYFTANALEFWVMSGPIYLSGCMAVGLGLVMIWSALEFIRFNTYRLFRLRKLRANTIPAVNN